MDHERSQIVTIGLVIIIAVVLFGGIGYALGNKQQSGSVQIDQSPSAHNVSTTPSSANVSSWKSYENTKYGYSFKYPATDWKLSGGYSGISEGEFAQVETVTIAPDRTVSLADHDKSKDLRHQIEISSTGGTDDWLDYIEGELAKTKSNIKRSTITFAGQSATQFTYTQKLPERTTEYKKIIFNYKSLPYVLTGVTKDSQGFQGIDIGNFDAILNSFKLTK